VTTIAFVTPSVRHAADVLRNAASDLEVTAGSLRGTMLPSMPAPVEADALAVLGTVVPLLAGIAGEYRLAAADLDGRLDRGEGQDGFEVFLRAFSAVASPFLMRDVVHEGSSLLRLLRGATNGTLRSMTRARAAVLAAQLEHGDEDLRTLAAYFRWQEKTSQFVPLTSGKQASTFFEEEEALLRRGIPALEDSRAGMILRTGSKVLAVVGLPVNAYIAVEGSPYHGVRGGVDRTVAGATVLATAAELTGVAALVPGGQVVVAVVLVGAGVWVVGNVIYDNRRAIAHAAVSAAHAVYDHRNLIADATVPGYIFYDQRHTIAHVATGGLHAAEDVGSTAVDGVASGGKKAIGFVGHALGL